jgi:TctA family transporter
MEFISNLEIGFASALSPINLLYCFIGCLLGTLIGVLPGLGPPRSRCCCRSPTRSIRRPR